MNEILVRTHKGEYNPGDDIYGVVYLNIVNPTAGRGIRLRFQGYEYFLYNSKDEFGNEIKYEAKKDYVDCTDIILYQGEEALMIGSYVFPFKVTLLTEIPGSFKTSMSDEWQARVLYWLKSEVIDAESIQASQYVVVLNRLPPGFTKSDPPQSVHVEQEVNRFIFFKKRLHLTARLTEQLQRSGDVGKLRLIITNDTGLDVASISIRLLRDIRLVSKPDKQLNPKDSRLSQMENKVYIQPEGGPFVVWENIISDCDQSVLNNFLLRGLDNIRIPFRSDESVPLCSSCTGHHIQCRYCIEVVVKLVGDTIATINIPILSLLHDKDKEWYSWQPPDWVYDSEILSTNSLFSVPSHILESEAFSGIPRFQALS